MAKFRCNAPYPGTQLADLRVVAPGMEFSLDPADEPAGPRNTWLPLDESARRWLADWNRDHPSDLRKPYPFARSHLPPYLRDIDPTKPVGATSPQSRAQLEPARPDEKDSAF